jgi:tRNA(Ile)-lysidine synthase
LSSAQISDDAVALDRGFWRAEASIGHRALEALFLAAGAQQRPPSAEQIAVFAAAASSPKFQGATLGGALVRACGEHVVFTRDRGALTGRADGAAPIAPLPLSAGAEAVWDGRVALTAPEPGWSVVVDGDAPVLMRGEERTPIAQALPHWLLKTRIRHVLGRD